MLTKKGGNNMLFLKVNCDTIWPLISLIKNGLIPAIQIGIPIILIVLGMLDLGKAVVASKEDEIKSAQKMLIKRCIYAVAVFFVVLLVTFVFGLVADNSAGGADEATNWTQCWDHK